MKASQLLTLKKICKCCLVYSFLWPMITDYSPREMSFLFLGEATRLNSFFVGGVFNCRTAAFILDTEVRPQASEVVFSTTNSVIFEILKEKLKIFRHRLLKGERNDGENLTCISLHSPFSFSLYYPQLLTSRARPDTFFLLTSYSLRGPWRSETSYILSCFSVHRSNSSQCHSGAAV